MSVAVLLLNFGEPEQPTPEAVLPFLERIFVANAALEGHPTREERRRRGRALAERRAPALIEEYRAIGGSPLHPQAVEQAQRLERELRRRGRPATVAIGMQFTDPDIPTAVRSATDQGVDRLVILPVYPLCGPSTTVAALESATAELRKLDWRGECTGIAGWHRHPGYVGLRADAIRDHAVAEGVELSDPGTRLVFSAHGSPMAYVEAGSRYPRYVEDCCARVAAAAGVPDYRIGFQNHSNRGIPWTEPEVGALLRSLEGTERVVVDPVSFMHEQSETLSELDRELRDEATAAGLAFHRVPIRHAADEFIAVLADLVEAALTGGEADGIRLGRCDCATGSTAWCLNAPDAESPGGGSSPRGDR